jgi:hypothetical protein
MKKSFFLLIALFFVVSCGGGGSESTAPTVIPPTTTPTTSDALLGNFTFVYNIISIWTDKVTLNRNSHDKSSEGTEFYLGYNADYPDVTTSAGAWYPSISMYVVVTVPNNESPYIDAYYFTINYDNTLSGSFVLITNDVPSDHYSFIIPASHKSPLGSWDMISGISTSPLDINDVFEKKWMETEAQRIGSKAPIDKDVASKMEAQQTGSVAPIDKDLASKINELRNMIKKHNQH